MDFRVNHDNNIIVKWYDNNHLNQINIWRHTVIVTVINAWNLYRRDQKKEESQMKPMVLQRFQALVGTSFSRAGKAKIKCGRPLFSP